MTKGNNRENRKQRLIRIGALSVAIFFFFPGGRVVLMPVCMKKAIEKRDDNNRLKLFSKAT
jgi:hypothetical protein